MPGQSSAGPRRRSRQAPSLSPELSLAAVQSAFAWVRQAAAACSSVPSLARCLSTGLRILPLSCIPPVGLRLGQSSHCSLLLRPLPCSLSQHWPAHPPALMHPSRRPSLGSVKPLQPAPPSPPLLVVSALACASSRSHASLPSAFAWVSQATAACSSVPSLCSLSQHWPAHPPALMHPSRRPSLGSVKPLQPAPPSPPLLVVSALACASSRSHASLPSAFAWVSQATAACSSVPSLARCLSTGLRILPLSCIPPVGLRLGQSSHCSLLLRPLPCSLSQHWPAHPPALMHPSRRPSLGSVKPLQPAPPSPPLLVVSALAHPPALMHPSRRPSLGSVGLRLGPSSRCSLLLRPLPCSLSQHWPAHPPARMHPSRRPSLGSVKPLQPAPPSPPLLVVSALACASSRSHASLPSAFAWVSQATAACSSVPSLARCLSTGLRILPLSCIPPVSLRLGQSSHCSLLLRPLPCSLSQHWAAHPLALMHPSRRPSLGSVKPLQPAPPSPPLLVVSALACASSRSHASLPSAFAWVSQATAACSSVPSLARCLSTGLRILPLSCIPPVGLRLGQSSHCSLFCTATACCFSLALYFSLRLRP